MLTSIALLLSSSGFAQTQAGPLEVVQVTASRIEETSFETARAVSVVGSSQLQAISPQIPIDALRGVAGVAVQQTTPGQGVPIVRGLKGSEVLHLVDGFRLNNAFFRNAPNQYLALVDATQLDQIEILRGPGSTIHGADALGGVVQFITRQPQFSDEGDLWQGQVKLRADSADEAATVAAGLSHSRARNAYRLDLSYQDVGDRQTARGTIRPSAYKARGGGFKWRYQDDHGGDWLLNLQYLQQPSTPRVDELVPGFGQTEPDSAEFLFHPNERRFGQIKYQRELQHSWADGLDLQIGIQDIIDDRRTRNFASNQRRQEHNKSRLWGLTAQLYRTLSPTLQWVYGADYYHDEVTSARTTTDLSSLDTEVVSSRFPSGSEQSSFAAYGQALWDLTEATQIRGGLRYSAVDIELTRAAGQTPARLDPDNFSASLGIHHYLRDELVLVANLGQGFRAPNIFDLGTLGARPGGRFNIPNANLQPEKLDSLDLGLKWRSSSWQGELAAFYAAFDDKISSVLTGQVTPDNRVIVQSQNVAEVDLWGVELGGRGQWGNGGQWYGVLNWTRGEETGPDGEQPADRVPPLNGRIGLSHLIGNAIEADFYVDFARHQNRLSDRDRRDPRINPGGTPGWATANLRVAWELGPQWDLSATLQNILDRHYREHGSGLDARGRNFGLSVSRFF